MTGAVPSCVDWTTPLRSRHSSGIHIYYLVVKLFVRLAKGIYTTTTGIFGSMNKCVFELFSSFDCQQSTVMFNACMTTLVVYNGICQRYKFDILTISIAVDIAIELD